MISPDGRHFATVTERGVLPEGTTEATLWVFESAAVRRNIDKDHPTAVLPVRVARLNAKINGAEGMEAV
jgi:hypothetical protein